MAGIMAMKLLVATRNRHKLREIESVFALPGLELIGVAAVPNAPEVVEDGDTFEANAVKKACTLADACGLWTLADDSGLAVDALGGEPGVRSARYAGDAASDHANNRKLLDALAGIDVRRACFNCVIALARAGQPVCTVAGICRGRITDAWRGDRGFGYDPLFMPDGYDFTFGEMDPDLKNRISHRGRALREAARQWGRLLSGASS